MIPEPSNRFGRKADETATAEELMQGFAEAEGMPWSDEAEKGFLSCLFQDPGRMMEARLKIQPQAFYGEASRTIFEELLTMDQEGIVVDMITLTTRLRDQGKLDTAGGYALITELFGYTPLPSHFPHYLKEIRDRWTLRREIHGHLLATQLCFRHFKDRQSVEVESTLNDCTQVVQMARDGLSVQSGTSATLNTCLNEHIDMMERIQKQKDEGKEMLIKTGFPTLDRNAGGIGRDEYWLVTGPTKSGKSILAGRIVKNAALKGWTCKIYSNEVQRVAYAGRFLASESSEFDGRVERHGFESLAQMGYYSNAVTGLQRTIGEHVIIDNAAGKYVEDVVADMRMEAEKGVALFVVDLIGKLRTRASHGTRERELAHISGCLCDATKKFNVACLVVCQENDDGAVRESKALGMDCEAWLKLTHVFTKPKDNGRGFAQEILSKEPEMIRDRRNIIIQLARGFASGDVIPCHFDGARFLLAELSRD